MSYALALKIDINNIKAYPYSKGNIRDRLVYYSINSISLKIKEKEINIFLSKELNDSKHSLDRIGKSNGIDLS